MVRHGLTGVAEVSCDLTQREVTAQMLAAVEPSIVIHLVGKTDVDACETDPNDAFRLNVLTVENIVSGFRHRAGAYLVHISTDHVYDAAGPSRESDVRLTNTYALSKYASELAAAQMPSAILRTSFFGNSLVPHRQSFSDWVLARLAAGLPCPVFDDVVVSPLSMVSLSRVICAVVEQRIEGTLNVGSRDALSKADIAYELAHVFGLSDEPLLRSSVAAAGLHAYRPTDMSMDCSLANEKHGLVLPLLREEIFALKGESYAAG